MARPQILTGFAIALGAVAMASTAQSAPAAGPVANEDISGSAATLAAAVPVIAVDPRDEQRVAIAWRFIAPAAKGTETLPGAWVCHLSLSDDGGKTFRSQTFDWGLDFNQCNAPYASFSSRGDLYVGATLARHPAASGPGAPPPHPLGAAVIARSTDAGKTWAPTLSVIASDMQANFAPAPFVPAEAITTPWDGARGAIDLQTGAIYVSSAFPAPPGLAARSQRFVSASTNDGQSFGLIRTFGAADWPERWDGDLAAAHGLLGMSYLGEATPDAAVKCLCAIFAVSSDNGATIRRSLVMKGDINVDTLVHYPELAADNGRKGRFAVALISADRTRVSALITQDAGQTWRSNSPASPADVVSVSRPALAFGPKGVLILAWRGYHADGSYDTYAAASRQVGVFGPAMQLSSESSRVPASLKTTYAVRGDFHTALAVGAHWAHVAWADVRDGQTMHVVYARVPLAQLGG